MCSFSLHLTTENLSGRNMTHDVGRVVTKRPVNSPQPMASKSCSSQISTSYGKRQRWRKTPLLDRSLQFFGSEDVPQEMHMKLKFKLLGITMVALLWIGCPGEALMESVQDEGNESPGFGSYAPCTDKSKCCTDQDIWCEGDPDGNPVCHCRNLWDCSKEPGQVHQGHLPPLPLISGTMSGDRVPATPSIN
jgi:hypothetical protein